MPSEQSLFVEIIANAVIDADSEAGIQIIESLDDEEEALQGTLPPEAEKDEVIEDYSNYVPSEEKKEEETAESDDEEEYFNK